MDMYCLNLVLSGVYFSHQERRLCGIPQAVHRHWKAGLDLGTRLLVPFGGKEIQESGVSVSCGEGGSVAVPRHWKTGPNIGPSLLVPLVPLVEEKTRNLGCMSPAGRGGSVAVPRLLFHF